MNNSYFDEKIHQAKKYLHDTNISKTEKLLNAMIELSILTDNDIPNEYKLKITNIKNELNKKNENELVSSLKATIYTLSDEKLDLYIKQIINIS